MSIAYSCGGVLSIDSDLVFSCGFRQKFADQLRGRLKADGLHNMEACSPRGLLPNSRTSLWLAVHRQPLEGATGIFWTLISRPFFFDSFVTFFANINFFRFCKQVDGVAL